MLYLRIAANGDDGTLDACRCGDRSGYGQRRYSTERCSSCRPKRRCSGRKTLIVYGATDATQLVFESVENQANRWFLGDMPDRRQAGPDII